MPPPDGVAPALDLAVHKEAGALGTFRATFAFPDGWRPERDVLVVLAPFSARRDREGKYDPAKLFEAAEALIAGLGDGDRVNVLSYQDLLHGESWFPKGYPFVENADDLFVRPQILLGDWTKPAEAVTELKALRERGVETVRNTSWFIELVREAALACETDDGRVKEVVVIADSHTTPARNLLAGLPVDVPLPDIRLEPLNPEWTAALFVRMLSAGIHLNFVVVSDDEPPVFREKRLRRMAETTHGFYVEWPDDEAAREGCVECIAGGFHRGLDVAFGESDANYIYTNRWTAGGGDAFTVYGRYWTPGAYTFTIRDTLTGYAWSFDVALPAETAAHPELDAQWAEQRILDGVWKLATYGPDDYLAYDLWQLARRHELALPELLKETPILVEPKPVKRPRGKGRKLEVPVLDEEVAIPAHSPLAELAPFDMLYVRYGRLRSALELLDMGYFYGRDVIQALGLHADVTMIEEKTQAQMCVRVSRRLTKLYEAAVAEVAQVSTGASVGEGLDVCFIMRVKMPKAYRIRMNQFRRAALDDHPGTTVRRFKHEGVVVTETLGPHNVVRSYFAMFEHTPRGATEPQTFAVSGNTWASVRRVLDVHVGKIPSIVANADFAQFRAKLPIDAFVDEQAGTTHAENVFVYVGGPAIQSLTDWRIEALKQEQQTVASHLRLLRDALNSYARDLGVLLDEPRWPDTIMGDLVEKGYLPGIPAHPGIGAYAFDPELQLFYSTRYGRLGWLTPMADLIDAAGKPRYEKPEFGASAAQLAWTDELILSRAITRPDPRDFKFAMLRALAGKETSDFSTFRDLMQRPGLAVAMKSRLLQLGGRGLGTTKAQIALNFLANKVKNEIKTAIGWTDKADPFAWAGDEICVVLDARLASRRTLPVDPPLAVACKVKNRSKAAAILRKVAKPPEWLEPAARGVARKVSAKGLFFVLGQGDQLMLAACRDARLLTVVPSSEETALRSFLPEKCHVLIRYDSRRGGELAAAALQLYGPAAEEQSQLTMARFESRYGNRLEPLSLEALPMMRNAPRPAGSQYFIDPVDGRIASTVYGLPGDFFMCGRVPLDAGIRKALAVEAVGYGAVVLRGDAIEFVGAAPNPGVAAWKKERRVSSMSATRQVARLRTTGSPDRLAKAVCSHDGYLWRLGLRGFELDAVRFEEQLDRAQDGARARAREARMANNPELWCPKAREYGVIYPSLPVEPGFPYLPDYFALEAFPHGKILALLEEAYAWQRWRLQIAPQLPRFETGEVTRLTESLGGCFRPVEGPPLMDKMSEAAAKLVGWWIICRGPAAVDELRGLLERADEEFSLPPATIEFIRRQAKEYLRIIEKQ